MTILNKTTQRGAGWVRAYEHATQGGQVVGLYDKYKQPSGHKRQAWQQCKEIMRNHHGHGLTITGGNCDQFTACFMAYGSLFVITKDNLYKIRLK